MFSFGLREAGRGDVDHSDFLWLLSDAGIAISFQRGLDGVRWSLAVSARFDLPLRVGWSFSGSLLDRRRLLEHDTNGNLDDVAAVSILWRPDRKEQTP